MLRIIFNPTEGMIVKNMPDSWEAIPQEIGCDFFDVVSFYFDDDKEGTIYDFYIDDIGNYKNLVTSVIPTDYPALVGTVVIGKSNSEGEDLNLTFSDMAKIFNHMQAYNPDKEDETKIFFFIKGVSR